MSLHTDEGCGEGLQNESNDTKLIQKLTESEVKVQESVARVEALEKLLASKSEECNTLKAQNSRLELDLVEANMKNSHNQNETNEVNKMKEQSEEILTRAKSIIFEKTKVCKNQELQIEALNAQVSSLKDVVSITKNLLEIRNVEVKHLEDQIKCMNDKVQCEKERQDLVHQKLEKMIRMNADLKREYETQLCLFTALRERYREKELAKGLVEPLEIPNGDSTSTEASSSNISVDESPETKAE